MLWNGFATFWPKPIAVVTLKDGTRVAGEPTRAESYRPQQAQLEPWGPQARAGVDTREGFAQRSLYRIGNFDLYNEDFRWVPDFTVESVEHPDDYHYVERLEWGPFVGRVAGLVLDGVEVSGPAVQAEELASALERGGREARAGAPHRARARSAR